MNFSPFVVVWFFWLIMMICGVVFYIGANKLGAKKTILNKNFKQELILITVLAAVASIVLFALAPVKHDDPQSSLGVKKYGRSLDDREDNYQRKVISAMEKLRRTDEESSEEYDEFLQKNIPPKSKQKE